jgi:tetratricopeptide (TPR) repeat protein
MLDVTRYTSGRIAVANLSATIDGLEHRRHRSATFEEQVELSRLLFLRGDLLGRIADHDRAESVAIDAIAVARDAGCAFYVRARLANRFHRFPEARTMLERALAAGHSPQEIDGERAALLQATGDYRQAQCIRERSANIDPGIHTLGGLASLLGEMGDWSASDACYSAALRTDRGVSPLPCAQLLFEWGVCAMRRGELDRAETTFATLGLILSAHVPGRGHRAEVALERGQLDRALGLILPLLDITDDPEYRATYAQILAARGDRAAAACEAEQAALEYERLLARRPEAYADHAASFFMGLGDRPLRALELATANCELRATPRARALLSRAQRNAVARGHGSTRRTA